MSIDTVDIAQRVPKTSQEVFEPWMDRCWDISVNHSTYRCTVATAESDLSFAANEARVAFDTEYEIRFPGDPQFTVVMSIAYPKKKIAHLVWFDQIQAYLTKLNTINPTLKYAMFSAPVDLKAVDYENIPFLYDKVWDPADPEIKAIGNPEHPMYDDPSNIVTCMQYDIEPLLIRYSLYEQATGDFIETMSLAKYAARYLGEQVDKDDSVRCTYTQDMEMTEEHIIYGIKDAIVTVELACAVPIQRLEKLKFLGYMGLNDMSERGYPADIEMLDKLTKTETSKLNKELSYISAYGIWPGKILGTPTGMSGGTTHFQEILTSMEQRFNISFPRTKAGSISTQKDDAEMAFIEKGRTVHPLIEHYKSFKNAEKMLSSYLVKEFIRADGRWHPRFSPMKKNGRTGASAPPIQTYPRKGDYRGIFSAPLGYVILASDICQAELCGLAQSNLNRFGFSKMAEVINSGEDLHMWFALNYLAETFKGIPAHLLTDEQTKDLRKDAKAVNFGLPGGLGGPAFILYAKNTYGRNFTLEQAKYVKQAWFEAFPECRMHMDPKEDDEWTIRSLKRKLADDGYSVGSCLTLEELEDFMREKGMTDDQISQLMFESSSYYAITYHGHKKRNCVYTSACNYEFSTMVADTASLAMARALRKGLPMINFVHDELHFLLKKGLYMQDEIKVCENVFLQAMRDMMPDINVKAESALMERWHKSAEPVFDDEGNLLLWTPDMVA